VFELILFELQDTRNVRLQVSGNFVNLFLGITFLKLSIDNARKHGKLDGHLFSHCLKFTLGVFCLELNLNITQNFFTNLFNLLDLVSQAWILSCNF
jgi:hypothetical protein